MVSELFLLTLKVSWSSVVSAFSITSSPIFFPAVSSASCWSSSFLDRYFLNRARQVFGVLSHSQIDLEIPMVTASQLQLLQSPITALIFSIHKSDNAKLNDSNYLKWNFQMQLLLESYRIMGYVDSYLPCPPQHGSNSDESSITSSSHTDEYIVWKMHDRAIMQLITAILSPIASGSTSSKDMWITLKE